MKYFFVLGNNPTLSIAELSAVFDLKNPKIIKDNILVAKIDDNVEAHKQIDKLGGVIKIGKIISTSDNNPKNISKKISKFLPASYSGKYKYGVSVYGKHKSNTKIIGM